MEAPKDSAEPPLRVRQLLDRLIGLADARLEEDVEIEPARDNDPEQVVGERAQVIERVLRIAERLVEGALGREKRRLPRALRCGRVMGLQRKMAL